MSSSASSPTSATPRRSRLAIVSTVLVAVVAAVPPTVSALQRMATGSVSASGGSIAAGRDVHVDDHSMVVNYANHWWRGAQLMAGAGAAAPAQPSATSGTLAAGAAADSQAEPETGSLGRLVTNASLMDGARWTVEPSRVARSLQFGVRVDGAMEPDKPGRLTVTLRREGKEVCTVGVNALSPKPQAAVYAEIAECHDALPAGERVTYQASIKADGATPMAIALQYVDARRR